ncbi:hypothetical protein D3C77_788790 [compost metagenome]
MSVSRSRLEVESSAWASFLDCTMTSAVMSKLCLSSSGSIRVMATKTRNTRLTTLRLANRVRKTSCK